MEFGDWRFRIPSIQGTVVGVRDDLPTSMDKRPRRQNVDRIFSKGYVEIIVTVTPIESPSNGNVNVSRNKTTPCRYQKHSSHAHDLILHPALPRISDNYTNTLLWGLLLEERRACRVLEDLTDSFPSTRRTFEEVASTDLLGYCLTLRGRFGVSTRRIRSGWRKRERCHVKAYIYIVAVNVNFGLT